ncbi:hypothetical protein F4775DRAFT_216418 [Biscogniauxia sp. FL1348]|nr:hypothetical protein F4775DRAFT_216418 [Biscogniauxia sp. FL1348]
MARYIFHWANKTLSPVTRLRLSNSLTRLGISCSLSIYIPIYMYIHSLYTAVMGNMSKMASARCLYTVVFCTFTVPAAMAILRQIDSPATPTYVNSMTDVHETTPAPQPQAVIDIKALGRSEYTLMVVNSHTAAIATQHRQNGDSPTATRSNRESRTVGIGETATVGIPTGVSTTKLDTDRTPRLARASHNICEAF